MNYLNYRYFSVRFDYEKRHFDIYHEKYGVILSGCTLKVHMRDLNNVYSSADLSSFENVECTHEKHLDGNCLAVCFSKGYAQLPFITVRINLDNNGAAFDIDANNDTAYNYIFSGNCIWGEVPEKNTFSISTKKTLKGIKSALGPASTPLNDALFNRENDSMLKFIGTSPNIKFDYEENCYRFAFSFQGTERKSFGIETVSDVYTNKFALRYKCINKNTTFSAPPAGFMTWYALMWNTNEETLLNNVKIQGDELKRYGATAIWVDWEWYHNDCGVGNERCDTFTPDPAKYPNGLKYVADEVKKSGLVPAIWIGATNDVQKNKFIKENEDTLLVEKSSWCGIYFFDPTNEKYLTEFIPNTFHQLIDWGYKAIKWDCLPLTIDYCDQYHDKFSDQTKTSEEALRNVIKAARNVVGDDIYMLSCHGEASRDITFAADLFDAARIGADIFKWDEFLKYCVDRVYKYYPLHNVVQYVDPDNVVIREEFNTIEQAKSRVSFVSLLGTPITIGDDLTTLSKERTDLLKRSLPPLDIHPMSLEGASREDDYTLVKLFVSTTQEDYAVVDVFNLTDRPLTVEVSISDLELDTKKEYLMFDFWNKELFTILKSSIQLELKPFESKVMSVKENKGTPWLLASNRHISCGAIDIKNLKWNSEEMTLSGKSSVVGKETYILYLYCPEGYTINESLCQCSDRVYRKELLRNENEDIMWSVEFKKDK